MITQSKPFLEKTDFDYINDILETSYLAQGKFVEELENEFCKLLGVRYACATSSGTTALHLSLLSLNIKNGDEVIIPSYTCSALLNAVNYLNAVPVVVDIDPKTFNLTYDIVKRNVTKRTKAIIVTHTFGFPADLDEILKLGISVIEDCAHAIGSIYKSRPAGVIGRISVFSMYATKMIAAGEGGMVCTSEDGIAETIRDLNNPDMRNSYRIRYNYKMSDMTAGLALNQLRRLNFFVSRRRYISEQYQKSFSLLPLKFQQALPETVPNYYRFVICTSKADEIIKFTQSQGIICDRPIFKSLHRYLDIDDNYFPVTNRVWHEAISIPIYPALTDDEVSKIISTILKAFEVVL